MNAREDGAAETLGRDFQALAARALGAGSMSVVLQPVVDMATGLAVGAEVLSRWTSLCGRPRNPEEAARMLGRAGLATAFDQWVVLQAIRLLDGWRDSLPEGFIFSVNVTKPTLRSMEALAEIVDAAADHGVDSGELVIEVTEADASFDVGAEASGIAFLAQEGFPVALDDFGSGYSSLHALSSYPVTIIKVDKAFLDLARNSEGAGREKCASLLHHVAAMAHDLGMAVVIEGVETTRDEKLAIEAGCFLAQGFRYGRPVPCARFERDWIASGRVEPLYQAKEAITCRIGGEPI